MIEMRAPAFSFGPELGWVECALGKTRSQSIITVRIISNSIVRVIAQVDAKMAKPQPERPFEGTISIHSEISPMASSEYEPGR